MEDVQGLFLKAIALRRICLVVCVVMLLFMILSKADLRTLLPSSLCIGTGLFFAVIAALAAIISTNFTKYFIMFHHMFFTNDLWILDPTTDMLINIVPEGFSWILPDALLFCSAPVTDPFWHLPDHDTENKRR